MPICRDLARLRIVERVFQVWLKYTRRSNTRVLLLGPRRTRVRNDETPILVM